MCATGESTAFFTYFIQIIFDDIDVSVANAASFALRIGPAVTIDRRAAV